MLWPGTKETQTQVQHNYTTVGNETEAGCCKWVVTQYRNVVLLVTAVVVARTHKHRIIIK
jgi:hypothetical protein